MIEGCEAFVTDKLQTEGFECHLTIARLWSMHAKILRHMVRFSEARVYYDKALARIYKRLQNSGNDARVNCEVARILAFGHGWIFYIQGFLAEAAAAVSTALVILDPTKDIMFQAYGQMLLCAVKRAMFGLEENVLSEVIEEMRTPYDAFKRA